MQSDELIRTVLEQGATKAGLIDGSSVVTDRSFRALCEANSCGVYGRCYTCPPDVGDIDDLIAKVRSYDKCLLYQLISPLEDSFDVEGMAEAARRFTAVCQKVLAALRPVMGPDAFFLTGGGCGLCKPCAKLTGEPCRHPDRAMPSLESCGVDVSRTAGRAGMKYINGQNTVTYFGAVLYTEKANA